MHRQRDAALLAGLGLDATRLAAPFPLWLVAVPGRLDPALDRVLSDEERSRAARFRTAQLSRRYRTAHGVLRLLGEHYFGVPAASQQYRCNAFGRLRLVSAGTARCSLSYSARFALVGWSRGEDIGVDMEMVRPVEDAPELMQLHYTANEQASLQHLRSCPAGFNRAFLAVWVRKEACVKALGRGLDVAPSSFDCGSGQAARTISIEGRSVCSKIIEAGNDFAIAWARCRATGD